MANIRVAMPHKAAKGMRVVFVASSLAYFAIAHARARAQNKTASYADYILLNVVVIVALVVVIVYNG